MIVVDTHVHVALHTYEPAEILLTQMQYNDVQHAVLVQSSTTMTTATSSSVCAGSPGGWPWSAGWTWTAHPP